jgi:hypothetical protein
MNFKTVYLQNATSRMDKLFVKSETHQNYYRKMTLYIDTQYEYDFLGKPFGKPPLEKPKLRWKDIKAVMGFIKWTEQTGGIVISVSYISVLNTKECSLLFQFVRLHSEVYLR